MRTYIHLDDADVAAFDRDGYLIKRGLFSADEIALCNRVIATDPAIQGSRLKLADAAGGSTELALWNHPGDDIFGMIARCGRVAGGAEKLLGGEVYHYHSKLTMKRPGGGGAGSGTRITATGTRTAASFPTCSRSRWRSSPPRARTAACSSSPAATSWAGSSTAGSPARPAPTPSGWSRRWTRLELVHCEMAAGDALFFHANTLHCSAANLSDKSRNLLICCYNKASNDPYKDHHHPRYTRLAMVADEAVLAAGDRVADAAGPVVPGGGQGRDHGGAQGGLTGSLTPSFTRPAAKLGLMDTLLGLLALPLLFGLPLA